MIRLGLVSDLHVDHWKHLGVNVLDAIPEGACDILVMAGDFCQVNRNGHQLTPLLRELRDKAEEVVYVPGNHEYYEDHFMATHNELTSACETVGIYFLSGESPEAKIMGTPFIGGSLWFDFEDDEVRQCLPNWSDSCIEGLHQNAPWFRRKEMEALKKATKETVVVTHFLPSYKSVSAQYAGDPYNCLFVTQGAEAIIEEKQPQLWLHGHTHSPSDYLLHRTRVVCKPVGYPKETRLPRNIPFIIEI